MHAISNNYIEIVELLLTNEKMDINIEDISLISLIFILIFQIFKNIIAFILNY